MSKPSISADQFLEAAAYRRTVYGLKGTSSVPDERVEDIVKKVFAFSPSSYNTQPVRATIVTGEKHKQFWDIVLKEAEPILRNAGAWDAMSGILGGHKNAYGTVVYWNSNKSIKEAGEKHKSAAHMLPEWAEHANAMHQINVWTALELEGIGANLQHVNMMPPVEAALKKFCGVPEDYQLRAQLVFGDKPGDHPQRPGKLPFSDTLQTL